MGELREYQKSYLHENKKLFVWKDQACELTFCFHDSREMSERKVSIKLYMCLLL